MTFLSDIGDALFGNNASIGDVIKGTGGLISTGLNVGNALFGNTPQQQAATAQQQLGQNQLDLAKQILSDARGTAGYTRGIADQSIGSLGNVIQASQAPITDARGNTYTYVPGQGYVTGLSGRSQQLQNASDAEMLAEMAHDLPQYRAGLDANAARRTKEGLAGDTMLSQALNNNLADPYSLQSMQDDLLQQATRGVNQAYDEQGRNVEAQAMRSGSGAAPILAQLAQKRAQDTTNAIIQARLAAPQMYEGAETSRQGRLNSQFGNYNTIAGRASNIGTPNFTPLDLTGGATSELNNLRSGLGTATTAASGQTQAAGTAGQVQAQNMYAVNPAFSAGLSAATSGNQLQATSPDPLGALSRGISDITNFVGTKQNQSGTTPTQFGSGSLLNSNVPAVTGNFAPNFTPGSTGDKLKGSF